MSEEEKGAEGTGPGSIGVRIVAKEQVPERVGVVTKEPVSALARATAQLNKEEAGAKKMMVLASVGLCLLGLLCVAGLMWALKLFLDSVV